MGFIECPKKGIIMRKSLEPIVEWPKDAELNLLKMQPALRARVLAEKHEAKVATQRRKITSIVKTVASILMAVLIVWVAVTVILLVG